MPCDSSAFWQGACKDNPVKAEIYFFCDYFYLGFGVVCFFFFIVLWEKEYLRSLLTANL